MKLALTIVACAALAACRKAEGTKPPAPAAQTGSQDGWKTYDDATLTVSYPPEFDVMAKSGNIEFGKDLKQSMDLFGHIIISPEFGPKGMLLRDSAEAMAKDVVGKGGSITGPIQRVAVAKGTCLGMVQGWSIYVTLCDGPQGGRYQITCALPSLPSDRENLPPAARESARIYARMLSSLELKK